MVRLKPFPRIGDSFVTATVKLALPVHSLVVLRSTQAPGAHHPPVLRNLFQWLKHDSQL